MRALEVCAGIGGLTLALEMAGFTTAGLCEIDFRCRLHLAEKWPHVPIFGDFTRLSDDDLRRVGRVDLLAGGIPCQPWSVAGKQGGSDDERDLWPAFFALAQRLSAAVLVENVAGLASDPRGFDRIAGDLEQAGYSWWTCSLRAADVGAPRLRDRLFVCAVAYDDAPGRREQRQAGAGPKLASGHDADRCGEAGGLAHPGGAGPQGGWRAGAGLQRPAAERGGAAGRAVGDADGLGRLQPGQPRRTPAEHGAKGTALANPWSDAAPILCRDGKHRLIPAEPAFFPLAHGSPGRVARLRALGNAVVPLQAYVTARALYEELMGRPQRAAA